ncbi:MAG: hypothetical protein KC413_19430, partial [Anaerolineales bacterium]|nr:hypothetical protein [Anaerolineales bacterium]
LGYAQTAGAVGGLIGGIAMSAWGGFKKRVHGVLIGWMISGIGMATLGLTGGLPIWIIGMVVGALVIPLVNGSNQAIWQAKVAPDVQGRVFSVRRLIAWAVIPLANLLVIPLTDGWLEPAMREGGSLVNLFSWLVGNGPGAGIGILFVFCGMIASLVGLSGYLFAVIRNAEAILPDHDELEQVQETAVADAPTESEPVPA